MRRLYLFTAALSFLLCSGCEPVAERRTTFDECRQFVTSLGEPDAFCYCSPDYDVCTVKLSNFLVYADCGQGTCTIIQMAGAGTKDGEK